MRNYTNLSLIVTRREYFPLVFALKRNHPEYAFKLLDIEELLDRASFRYASSPIPFLLTLGMDYVSAKKWMRIFRVGDLEKLPKAKSLWDKLPSEILEVDPLGNYELSSRPIYLLELQEDIEIHALLKRKGFAFEDITLEDLGCEVCYLSKRQATVFKNKYEQYSYIFASLRKRIIQEGLDPSSILIHVKDEGDAFYLQSLGEIYGVKTRIKTNRTLSSSPAIDAIISRFYAQKSLLLSEDEIETEEGKAVSSIIKEYRLDALKFSLGYTCLVEILQATGISGFNQDRGILATSSFTFAPDKEIFLTDFTYGNFYKEFTDDDVCDDTELLSMSVNPSYIKSKLEKHFKTNYLRYQHFALYSRVKEHLDDKIYASQLLKEEGFEEVSNDEPDGLYTTQAIHLCHAKQLDDAFYYLPVDVYRSYDSRFQGIPSYTINKDHYSVTNLESYIRCPYQYYLKTVLPRSDINTRPRYAGVMAHKALEGLYSPDYDMEAAIEEGKRAYIKERDENEEAIPLDEVMIELTANNLRRYIPFFLAQKKAAKILCQYSEKRVNWTLEEAGKKYPFKGSIDSLYLVGEGQEKYYVLIDYKTGIEKFLPYEVFLGRSTQLPLYYYALKQEGFDGENQARFGGMGLKRISFPTITSSFKDSRKEVLSGANAFKEMSADGVYLNETNFWEDADNTGFKETKGKRVITGKGYFLSGGSGLFDLHGEGNLSGLKGPIAYGLEDLIQEAVNSTLATIHKIERGEFPLAPTSSDLSKPPSSTNIACTSCPYKDVCYHLLRRDKKDYSAVVHEHFEMKKKGA